MPRFLVLPTDISNASTELIAPDAGGVLPIIQRLDCMEADVTQDGVYIFSARLGTNGIWSIFHRYNDNEETVVQLFA